MSVQGEAVARIEVKLDRLMEDVEKMGVAQRADAEELAALKNKGAGILIGVGLLAGSFGAWVVDLFSGLHNAIK